MSSPYELTVGRVDELGAYRFDPKAVADFAERFDPLALRRSDAETGIGEAGRSVSPWHIAAAFMRLNVDFHRELAAGGRAPRFGPSPGVSDMVCHRDVRAGETLLYRQSVLDKRRAPRREDWTIVTTRIEAQTESGDLAFSMTGRVYVHSR